MPLDVSQRLRLPRDPEARPAAPSCTTVTSFPQCIRFRKFVSFIAIRRYEFESLVSESSDEEEAEAEEETSVRVEDASRRQPTGRKATINSNLLDANASVDTGEVGTYTTVADERKLTNFKIA